MSLPSAFRLLSAVICLLVAAAVAPQASAAVTKVAAGDSHSLYVTDDGTLWAMGNNGYGQLGDGTTTSYDTPVQITTGVIAVAAGAEHSLFVKNDGTLWAMGYNSFGQLGNGTTGTQQRTPVQVATGVNVVSAGGYSSLFVKNDGTLWAMGSNGSSQLGDGTFTERHTPVQVATGVIAAAIGGYHSLFVKNDGMLWGMGANYDGQLGDGATLQRILPAGFIAPAITAQPASQTVNAGQNATFVVAASGTPAPSLQWQVLPTGSSAWVNFNATNVITITGSSALTGSDTGVTTGTLTVTATDVAPAASGNGTMISGTLIYLLPFQSNPALNGTQYRCIATNFAGSATSNAATLTVNYAPVITAQPADQFVGAGASATFAIIDTANPASAYQWQSAPSASSAWTDISGATSVTFTIASAAAAMDGTQYHCVATNFLGSATSNAATLHVFPDPAIAAAQELKTQLQTTGTATITVTGSVDLALVDGATLTSAKTIVGADDASTITGGLTIATTASNTVILGVNFTSGALNIDGADDVTVTNCTFTDTPVSITGGADNTAFAWNKFTATAAGKAGGGSAMRIDNAGATIGILLQDNLWADGLLSDMPAVTNARVLMFNNYFTAGDAIDNATATIAGANAQILSQNNIYQGTNNPLLTQDGGLLCALGNFMTETTGTTAAGTDTVFVPAYSYTMLPAGIDTPSAAMLAEFITTCAGNTDGKNSVAPSSLANANLRIAGQVDYPSSGGSISLGAGGSMSLGSSNSMLLLNLTTLNPGTTQPKPNPVVPSTTVRIGGNVTLTANATDNSATWQWYHNNFSIAGATGAAYTIVNATTADAGAYSVAMTSTSGEIVTSGMFNVVVDASDTTTGGGDNGGNQANNSGGGGGGGAPSLWYAGAIACLAALRMLKHNRSRA